MNSHNNNMGSIEGGGGINSCDIKNERCETVS